MWGDAVSDYLEDRTASKPKSLFEKWVVPVCTIITTGSLLVGGVWAYFHFDRFEEPELHHRASLDGSVEWRERSKSDCIGWFKIKFANIGRRPIKLTDLTFNVWYVELGAPNAPVTYIDVVNGAKSTALIDVVIVPKTEPNEPIIETIYPPGVSDEVRLMVHVKRDAGKLLMFKATGQSKLVGDDQKHPWYTHQVEYGCNEKPRE